MKKILFSTLFAVLFMGCSAAAKKKSDDPSKPNILIIHVDDFGYHDMSGTGSKIYQTPNIDALAKNARSFESAYSSYPRCTPSRYGLMTGTYPVNEDHGYLAGIRADQNFAKLFSEAGYVSQYVGKWHLGGGESAPKGFGFTESFAAGEAGSTGQQFYPFNVGNAGKEHVEDVEAAGKKGDYLTDLLTDQTIKFITKNAGKKPFLAHLAYYSVHTPLEGKPEDVKRNKAEIAAFDFGKTPEYVQEGTGRTKMRQDNADYAAMVENVDENVGRLLALLKELKIDKNTIVVLTSDHGGLSNDGKKKRILATTNYPLRAGKGHLYEGGIRVPLLISWPKKIKSGIDKDNIVLGMDLYPTLLDLAIGKKVDGIDGKSFKNCIENTENWRDRTVFWYERKSRPTNTGDTKCAVVRSGDYKLMHFFEANTFELYNVKTDISETKNLYAEQPELAKKMTAELEAWKKEYLTEAKLKRKKEGKANGKKKTYDEPDDDN